MESALRHPKGKEESLPARMRLPVRKGTLSGTNLILKNSILGRKPLEKIGRKVRAFSEDWKIGTDFHRTPMNKSSHCFRVTQGRWQNNRMWESESWREGFSDPTNLSGSPRTLLLFRYLSFQIPGVPKIVGKWALWSALLKQ